MQICCFLKAWESCRFGPFLFINLEYFIGQQASQMLLSHFCFSIMISVRIILSGLLISPARSWGVLYLTGGTAAQTLFCWSDSGIVYFFFLLPARGQCNTPNTLYPESDTKTVAAESNTCVVHWSLKLQNKTSSS